MFTIKFILIIIFLIVSVNVFPQPLSNDKTVSLSCNRQSLRSILENIRTQTGINLVYQDKLTNNLNVTCDIKNYSIENALRKILDKTEISFKYYQENSVVLFKEILPVLRPSKPVVTKQDVPLVEDSSAVVPVHTFSLPEMISSYPAIYPHEAVEDNVQGNVRVRFLVDSTGSVSRTIIEASSGFPILDSAAADYLHKSRFIPAKADGKPIQRWLSLIFQYCIK